MPTANELIEEIERNVSTMLPYSNWLIGMTEDPEKRHRELEYPGFWRFWPADDEDAAKRVVEHFVALGARREKSDGRHPTFVFMY